MRQVPHDLLDVHAAIVRIAHGSSLCSGVSLAVYRALFQPPDTLQQFRQPAHGSPARAAIARCGSREHGPGVQPGHRDRARNLRCRPKSTASSQISMWPPIIAAPPILQFLPMRVLPAMPTQPAIAVCAPIRQLCPTWIWLSSLTSFSITVSSIAPRSIVVLAPTSTSRADHDAPDLRDLEPAPVLLRHAEAVRADDGARMQDAARTRRRSGRRRVTLACRTASSPIDAPGADDSCRHRCGRARR
mgnify:CR=1 FL=1